MHPAGGAAAVLPPLAVDIDGTLTDDRRALDERMLPALREWAAEAPVIVATGKALPYPIALCEFLATPTRVIAENGGAVYIEPGPAPRADGSSGDAENGHGGKGELRFTGDRQAAADVAREYEAEGYDVGWGPTDFVNRWRETEFAVAHDSPLGPLERIAADHGMDVVDTGFAYHVKSPEVDKGRGLRAAAEALDLSPAEFAAVGDSENDAELLALAGRSFAVANADDAARTAADTVCESAYADGFLEAVAAVRDEFAD
jgi:hydroxymethylpyrimidine pyrophosphatase-like HAD family hydrolase